MTNRRKIFLTVIATAFLALCLPTLAAAQGRYDPYGRDRDYGRNRRDDDRYGRYDQRYLRDSIRRLENLSDRFEGNLDRALDRSRVDGTRREDNINDAARDFHRAANRLRDRFDDGRNLNRSADEARRVLDLGARLDRIVQHVAYDGRVRSDWMQIRQELRVIGDAYGYRSYGYGDDDYYRDDQYRRNDPYRRNRNAQRVGEILRRIPF